MKRDNLNSAGRRQDVMESECTAAYLQISDFEGPDHLFSGDMPDLDQSAHITRGKQSAVV